MATIDDVFLCTTGIAAGVGAIGAVMGVITPDIFEIQSEVASINSTINNRIIGNGTLTTGPIMRDPTVTSFATRLRNNNSSSKLVTLTFNQLTGGSVVPTLGTPANIVVSNNSFVNFTFMSVPTEITDFEIVFSGMSTGVYGSVAGLNAFGNMVAANLFRHSDLVPLNGN